MEQIANEILLRAKKEVFSNNFGVHTTLFKGEGIDFCEIKEYSYGDDIRKINWIATAKNSEGNLQVNQFNDEKELNIIIAFFVSGSINFGSVNLKQDTMAEIVALLGFSATKHNDRFQTIFYDEAIKNSFDPTRDVRVLDEIVSYAVDLDPLKSKVDYKTFVEMINQNKKRSLIFLVGDFLDEDIDLSSIAYKNEVYAIVVRDKLEEDISYLYGEYNLIDPNSFNQKDINIDKTVAQNYALLMKEHDDNLFEHFIENKIKYGKVYTHDDIFIALSTILEQ